MGVSLSSGTSGLHASFVSHTLHSRPEKPGLHCGSLPSRIGLSLPSASEPSRALSHEIPPNPSGQLQLPSLALQWPYCRHLKLSRLQLKHGGHFGSRSSIRASAWLSIGGWK